MLNNQYIRELNFRSVVIFAPRKKTKIKTQEKSYENVKSMHANMSNSWQYLWACKWVNDGFSVPSRPQRTRGKKQALEFFWRHLGCLNMIFLIANDVKHGGRTPQKWPICSILKVMRLESWKKCIFLIFFNFCRL